MGSQPCDGMLDHRATVAAAFGPGQPALESFQPPLAANGQARTSEHLAGGQRRADGNASVHAHYLPGAGPLDWGRDHGESHVPAADLVELHPKRPGFRDGAGPSEPHPACFGNIDLPDFTIQPTDVAWLDGHDPESLIATSFTPGGFVVRAVEVVCHGLSMIPKCLLLDYHASRRKPWMLLPGCRQLAALFHPARRAFAAQAPPRLLLDGQIPYKAGMCAMVP